jgi:1-acyl-sn-glycerol-3-phosphate acyltransferase
VQEAGNLPPVRVRKVQEKRSWAIGVAVVIIKPTLIATTNREWIDGDVNFPAEGGCVVVLNHLSHLDPLTAALLFYDHGRIPRYLAKDGLFHNKALGFFLRQAGQIPVHRETPGAVGAYDAAVAAVRQGQAVIIYPEATITRDPDLWPMRGKSGAARIALETGCPVIPVGQWGAQDILPPYTKKPLLFPRKNLIARVGPPVELADLAAREPRTTEVISEATDRIMAAITHQVELIRGEQAPDERYDMRIHGDRFKDRKKAS